MKKIPIKCLGTDPTQEIFHTNHLNQVLKQEFILQPRQQRHI